MTKKELLWTEIEKLDDEELDELFNLIQGWAQARQETKSNSLMSRLKKIKIDGPRDFAVNHDLYSSGEKSAKTNSG